MEPTTAQVEAQPNTNPTETPAPNPSEGIQKRFDEMTAKQYELSKQNQELMERLTQATVQLAQNTQPARPAEVSPVEKYSADLDPRLIETMKAMESKYTGQLRQMQMQLEAKTGAMQIQQQAAAMRGLPPEVAQRAAQLYEQSKLNGSAATPEEALRYAMGDFALAQMAKGQAVLGVPTTAFSPPSPGFNAPNPQVTSPVSKAVPAGYDTWTLDQQINYMEKNGLGDQPL
jgi:hypothetical protein